MPSSLTRTRRVHILLVLLRLISCWPYMGMYTLEFQIPKYLWIWFYNWFTSWINKSFVNNSACKSLPDKIVQEPFMCDSNSHLGDLFKVHIQKPVHGPQDTHGTASSFAFYEFLYHCVKYLCPTPSASIFEQEPYTWHLTDEFATYIEYAADWPHDTSCDRSPQHIKRKILNWIETSKL